MPSRTACAMSEPTEAWPGKRSALEPIRTNGRRKRPKPSALSETGLRMAPSTRTWLKARRCWASRVAVPVGREDQQRGALLRRAILRAAGDLGPERVGDIGDDEAEHAGAAGAHADREVVALVAGGLDGLEDAGAGLVVDFGAVGEGAGDGALRDTGRACATSMMVGRRSRLFIEPPLSRRYLLRVIVSFRERYRSIRPARQEAGIG